MCKKRNTILSSGKKSNRVINNIGIVKFGTILDSASTTLRIKYIISGLWESGPTLPKY